MTTIRYALLCCIALFCGGAWADGVPLFKADKPLSAAESKRILALRPTKSVVPVVVNKYALDANVITIDIAGKQYRFVGKKTDTGDGDLWIGTAPEGRAMLGWGRFGASGQIFIGDRMFYLAPREGRMVLAEAVLERKDDMDGFKK